MRTDYTKETGPILYDDMKRNVLVVDDEDINRELLGAMLSDEYEVLYAEDGDIALEILKENYEAISAVLLDLIMPNMNGIDVLKIVKEDPKLSAIPVIVLTADNSAEVECLNLGAVDFIPKPYDAPEVIIARVKRNIELSEGRTVIQSMERDELTGLLSKDFFYKYSVMTEHFYRSRAMDAVILNIDHFHLINEIYGREFGDKMLKAIADTIYKYVRTKEGTAARGDADTFYLYIERQEDYSTLLEEVQGDINALSSAVYVHVRCGVYCKEDKDMDMEVIFDRAKLACNAIRGNFKEKISYYDVELKNKSVFSERLIQDMMDGIEHKQFKVYYQPKYAIQGEKPKLTSAEALVRWEHPDFGLVSPGAFIPLFEENGLIQTVDHFVWEQVASDLRVWKDKFGDTVPVSVNMSRIDVYDSEVEDRIFKLLSKYHLSPSDFHLEITESAYSEDADYLIEVIERLRHGGFIVEMDDFGAGYSSLNMLSSMPIDVLKMDMKFVKDMHKDSKRKRMIELVLDIAEFLGVPVVAEGVEYKEQYEFLKEKGCDIIQGYYFSKPLPFDDYEAVLETAIKEGGE
ncbi:MAG: EAL domain-containing protein [Lachnospiraceae bacterium]|nr:EAL domain-containing protein [Lachnospiraceae bacterium]